MKKIILYTTETWPHCRTAKEFLREKGYSFTQKDVNKDPQARAEFAKRGFQGVPAFVIGDDEVVGLDKNKIESLIDYKVIDCPNCKTRLRVPKDKGKIKITCPKCSNSFIVKS
jgi:glutaredoxin